MKGTLLITLVALLLILVSCGPQAAVPTATDTSTQAVRTATPAKLTWEQEWEKLIAGAKTEGKVVAYSTAGAPVRAALSEEFKKKFGLELEFVTGRSAELVQKIFTEQRAGIYLGDIYIGGGTDHIISLKPGGALDPLKPALFHPEVINEKAWWNGTLPFIDKDRKYSLAFSLFPVMPVVINSDLIKTGELKSYKELLGPKWKGKVVLCDPTTPGGGLRWVGVIGDKLIGYDYLRDIAKQDLMITRDERQGVEWVARGKYSIVIGPKTDPVAEFIKAGAPIKWLPMEEGTWLVGGPGIVASINKAAHPNATKLFVNWLLTKEVQTIYSRVNLAQSARLDVPTDHLEAIRLRDEKTKYFNSEDEEFLQRENEFMTLAKEIFGPLVK